MGNKIKIKNPGLIKAFGSNRIDIGATHRLDLNFLNHPNIDIGELESILGKNAGTFNVGIATDNPEILYRIAELFNKSRIP